MKILFSAIGTADPMTSLGDGPMLHIVRHCRPEKVILFLSPKMRDYQEQDQRYTRAIEDLAQSTEWAVPDIEVIKSDFEEVYRFDHYIEEFESLLGTIRKEHPNDELLVNASSGTPGMLESLVALGAFGRYGLSLLQVTTPRKDVNRKHDREDPDSFDYDLVWECNPDNEDGSESRIQAIELPNFEGRLLRERAISLVNGYHYSAAFELVKDSPFISDRSKEMLSAASKRLMLDQQEPARVFSTNSMGDKSICYRSDKPLHEYISMLEVRLRQGNYADFVRALTPAITESIFAIIDPVLPKSLYLVDRSIEDKSYRFDAKKIAEDPELQKMFASFLELDRKDYLANKLFAQNWSLSEIADRIIDDKQLLSGLHKLFEFENGKNDDDHSKIAKKPWGKRAKRGDGRLRNKLAHQIRKMDKDTIEELGGMKLDDVMKTLLDLNDAKPGLYDRINDAIVAEL